MKKTQIFNSFPEGEAMSEEEYYRQSWMTDAQYECALMLAHLMGGFHHIPNKIKQRGAGIEANVYESQWATFDFDGLTRAVILAHARYVRFEIAASGPGMVKLVLHKRETDGLKCVRHPGLDDLMKKVEDAKYLTA